MDFWTFFDFWGLAKIFIFSGSGSAGSGLVSGSAGSGSKSVRFPVPGSVRKLPGNDLVLISLPQACDSQAETTCFCFVRNGPKHVNFQIGNVHNWGAIWSYRAIVKATLNRCLRAFTQGRSRGP